MTANQVHKKKIISLIDEIFNKVEQCHMLMSDQDCNTFECKIYYTERLAIITAKTMIQMHIGVIKQGSRFSQQYIPQRGLNK